MANERKEVSINWIVCVRLFFFSRKSLRIYARSRYFGDSISINSFQAHLLLSKLNCIRIAKKNSFALANFLMNFKSFPSADSQVSF